MSGPHEVWTYRSLIVSVNCGPKALAQVDGCVLSAITEVNPARALAMAP